MVMKRGRKRVPKNKWTSEEEAALQAGVKKYKPGQWRTILEDPQFASILESRSNVDLKDKWRNISVSADFESRKKAKLASKRRTRSSDPMPLSIVAPPPLDVVVADDNNGPVVDATTPAALPPTDFAQYLESVEKVVLEVMTSLGSPDGLDAKSILLYVEEHIKGQNMRRTVASRLRNLTKAGTLVKMKQIYRLSQEYLAAGTNPRSSQLLLEGNQENSATNDENGVNNLMLRHVGGLFNGMTDEEAAALVAELEAEAEFLSADAAEAERTAQMAEAKSEAEEIFKGLVLEVAEYWRLSQTP